MLEPTNPSVHEVRGNLAAIPDWALAAFLEQHHRPTDGDRRQRLERIESLVADDDESLGDLRRLPPTVEHVEAVLEDLPEPADAAVEGLLRHAGLPVADEPEARLEQARTALLTGQVTDEHLRACHRQWRRVDEAVPWLRAFQRQTPPAESFRLEHGLPPAPRLEVLHEQIRQALYRGRLPLRALVDHLDALRRWGRQHLFLYRLRPDQEPYLGELADSERWRRRLAQLGLDDRLVEGDAPGRFVWQPDEPEIAAVRLGDHDLEIQWVETRRWTTQDPRHPDRVLRHAERVVNFFHVDLRQGEAELKLQKIEHQPQHELRRSLRLYRRLVGELVDLERFTPILLEPAARRFLGAPYVRVQSWKVERADGSVVGGQGGQSGFFRGIGLVFRDFFTLSLTGDWRPQPGRPLRVRLDGRRDELYLPWETDEDTLRQLLDETRRLGRPMTAPEHPDPEDEVHAVILAKVQERLEKTDRREMPLGDLKKLVRGLGFTLDQAIAALETGVDGFERLLDPCYLVYCPNTRRPVAQRFDRRDRIPQKVRCGHRKCKNHTHQTEGHVHVRLPHFKMPPPDLRRALPFFYLTAVVAFTVVLFAFVSSLDWQLWQSHAITAAFVLVLITEILGVKAAVGHDRWIEAFEELRKIYHFVSSGLDDLKDWLLGRILPWRRRKAGCHTPASGA